MATTSAAAQGRLEHLAASLVELHKGLEGSFDSLGKRRVSTVVVVDGAGVAVSVVVDVGGGIGAELEVEVDAVVVAVVAAFEAAAAVAVAAAAVEAVDPSGQRDSEQIPMPNWPDLPLHPVQQKLEVQGAVAHRLVTNLAACLAQPSVGRASNPLDVFSLPPASVDPPQPLHVAIDALTRLHSSIALAAGATEPCLTRLVRHVRTVGVSLMPVVVDFGMKFP